jgi:hypothetical protein
LLGAAALLGLRSAGVLHPALVPAVRRAALINLGLNIVVSFLPQVNMAAHFGGAAVGAVAMLSGALTWGLPRYGPGDDFTRRSVISGWLASAAWILVGAYVASIALAWNAGKPWEPAEENRVEWHETGIDRLGIQAELPTSLERLDEPDEDGIRYVRFGNLARDPLVVRVGSYALAEPLDSLDVSDLEDAKERLRRPDEGFEIDVGPDCRPGGGGPYCFVRWRSTDEDPSEALRYEIAMGLLLDKEVAVYAAYRGVDSDRFENTAERIAESIRSR